MAQPMPSFAMPDPEPARDADAGAPPTDEGDAPGGDRPAPEPPAQRPRSRRRLVVGALAAAAAGAGLALSGAALVDAAAAARERAVVQTTLDDYLGHIAAGEFLQAARSSVLSPEADRALVDREVQPTTPAAIECATPVVGQQLATSRCRITLSGVGGDRASTFADAREVLLERGPSGWRVAQGLETAVELRAGFPRAERIAGEAVDPLWRDGARFWLYPGSYEASVRSPEVLGGDEQVSLSVTAAGGWLDVGMRFTEQLQLDLQAAAIDRVRACAEGGGEDCPDGLEGTALPDPSVASMSSSSGSGDPFAVRAEVQVTGSPGGPVVATVDVRIDFGGDLDRYDVTSDIRG